MQLSSKVLLGSMVVGSAFGLGMFVGEKTAPAKVVQKESTTEKEKVVQKEAEKSVEEFKVDKKEQVAVKKVKIQIEKPDGTKIQIEKEDTATNTHEVKEVIKYVEKEVVVEREKIVEKKSERIVENRANWMVGAKLGLDSLTPTATNYIVGVEVDRRILGPVWLGIWATTNPTFNRTAAGLSLKMEF